MFGVGLERWRARGGRFVRVLCGLLCFKDKVNLIPSAYGKKAAEGKGRDKCGLMLQGFNTRDLWLLAIILLIINFCTCLGSVVLNTQKMY